MEWTNDRQVSIRGERIDLAQIEKTIAAHPAVQDVVVATPANGRDEVQLVAYVVPRARTNEIARAPEHERELASRWRTVWNETYGQLNSDAGSFNTVGWNSSYTGAPLPEVELRECVDRTVERILSLRPQRVLEIGCGTGLMLLRVAPHCLRYVATDVSAEALEYVCQQLRRAGTSLAHVTTLERSATDLQGVDEMFDLVILNSVIQYFPSGPYLVEVLERVARTLVPGGAIFLGDVRSLPLLRALRTSVALHHATDSLATHSLVQMVRKQVVQETELVVDPRFFTALRRRLPAIGGVVVEIKKGACLNEVTKFRYDVTLRLESRSEDDDEVARLDWDTDQLTVEQLRRRLIESRPRRLIVTNVPSSRIATELRAIECLDSTACETVGELRRALAGAERDAAIDPQVIWAFEKDVPYSVSIGWLGAGANGCVDVVFRRRGAADGDRTLRCVADEPADLLDWPHYVNDPSRALFARRLVQSLRSYTRAALSEHMIPSAFILVDQLPQTRAGEVAADAGQQ